MSNGRYGNGKKVKSIEEQVQDIFDENKNYEYKDLIYKLNIHSSNIQSAVLIVNRDY